MQQAVTGLTRPSRIPLRWIGALQAQVKRALPATSRCCAEAFKISRSASSWADPMCSMSRDPRWQDSTICTAAAPDAVSAVRTDVHTGLIYGPGLVHKSLDLGQRGRGRPPPPGRAPGEAERCNVRLLLCEIGERGKRAEILVAVR